MLMLLCVHVTRVLFLVLVGNSALTMGFYWSYMLLLQLPVLMCSCTIIIATETPQVAHVPITQKLAMMHNDVIKQCAIHKCTRLVYPGGIENLPNTISKQRTCHNIDMQYTFINYRVVSAELGRVTFFKGASSLALWVGVSTFPLGAGFFVISSSI